MGYNTVIETPSCMFSCTIVFSHSFCPDTIERMWSTGSLKWWMVKTMQLKALLYFAISTSRGSIVLHVIAIVVR